jgi:hypothetical protein
MSKFLEAALAAAKRGWPVFPLLSNTKRPAIKEWESRATTEVEVITRCWSRADYNIGIATGPAGLVVLDFDMPKEGESVPEYLAAKGVRDGLGMWVLLCYRATRSMPLAPYWVATPSGGEHFYYAAPRGQVFRNTQAKLGWKIDTRAWGGYVVGAGSIVDGREYVADQRNDTLETLPKWVAALLKPAPLPPPPAAPTPLRALATDRKTRYVNAAIAAETQRVEKAPKGQRNFALYVAAQALGQLVAGGELSEERARSVLLHAAGGHLAIGAYSPYAAEHTITSGLRAGARRPRKVAA